MKTYYIKPDLEIVKFESESVADASDTPVVDPDNPETDF